MRNRHHKMQLVAAIIMSLIFAAPVFSADVAKIGVVDFQRFLTASNVGKDAQERFKKQGTEMEKNLKAKEAEIKELRDRLERESMVMSKEMREQKEREYRIKINDFKALEKKFMTELKSLENSLLSEVRADLLAMIEDVGKKGGYLIIIDRAVAHYYPASIDITDQLIQQYNESAAKDKKKQSE